jgi:hypothetical protein
MVIHTREVFYPYEASRASTNTNNMLDGHNFLDCTIVGPAVLLLLHDCSFSECRFESPQVVWPLDTGRAYFGAIGMQNCSFTNCRFERIGIGVDRATADKFTEALAQPGGGSASTGTPEEAEQAE